MILTLDYSLDAEKNGGMVSAFSYAHGLNELAGSWSASVAGGNFKAGNSISFAGVLKNGIITRMRRACGTLKARMQVSDS